MTKCISAAVVLAVSMSIGSFAAPQAAFAKSDKAAKAQLQDCKKLADPKMKDECVKKAGKGADKASKAKAKGDAMKADKAGKKGKNK